MTDNTSPHSSKQSDANDATPPDVEVETIKDLELQDDSATDVVGGVGCGTSHHVPS